MNTAVQVGGWEHACCGPEYALDTVVGFRCLVERDPAGGVSRYVECRHEIAVDHGMVRVHGRVVDIRVQHLDGSTQPIDRLPSGLALSAGCDEARLQRAGTHEPLVRYSDQYLVTVAS